MSMGKIILCKECYGEVFEETAVSSVQTHYSVCPDGGLVPIKERRFDSSDPEAGFCVVHCGDCGYTFMGTMRDYVDECGDSVVENLEEC